MLTMPNEWIMDVLDDLRDFSDANALPDLSAALDRARDVARKELAAHQTPGVSLIHASFTGEPDINGPIRRHS